MTCSQLPHVAVVEHSRVAQLREVPAGPGRAQGQVHAANGVALRAERRRLVGEAARAAPKGSGRAVPPRRYAAPRLPRARTPSAPGAAGSRRTATGSAHSGDRWARVPGQAASRAARSRARDALLARAAPRRPRVAGNGTPRRRPRGTRCCRSLPPSAPRPAPARSGTCSAISARAFSASTTFSGAQGSKSPLHGGGGDTATPRHGSPMGDREPRTSGKAAWFAASPGSDGSMRCRWWAATRHLRRLAYRQP